MLKNYLLITFRSLRKHPAYTVINVFGLAIGLACCLMILLYMQDELTADDFHHDANRTYRLVETHASPTEGEVRFAATAGPVGPALKEAFPEVEETVRVLNLFRPSIRRGNQGFYEAEYLITEPSFFDVFDFEVVQGDPVAALTNPGFVILTESAVQKYFGQEDPMGQTLTVSAMGEMEVAAIMKDPPRNSHLVFNMLFSNATLNEAFGENWDTYVANWHPNSRSFSTYLKLQAGVSGETLEAKLPAFFAPHQDAENPEPQHAALQPLAEVYLDSADINTDFFVRGGERAYLYIFSAIALFIILIACINYMNLATARSMRRAKEVGLRKTIGAHRTQLIRQFLSEAVVTALVAMVLALGLVQVALPMFNSLANKALSLNLLENGPMVLALVGLVLVVGVAAGSYPAFFLARFRPAQVLKGTVQTSHQASLLRRGLVVAQFTLSISMIIGTLIAADQLDYVRTKHLGFNEAQKLVFDINSGAVRNNAEAIKASFLQHTAVQDVSITSRVPGDWKQITDIDVVPKGTTDFLNATFIATDADFLDTFEITLADGRGFEEGRAADSAAVLLNVAAAQALGWEDPVGQRIQVPQDATGGAPFDVLFEATVIGVVDDFHFRSLHEPIRPLVLGWINNPIRGSDYITASVTSTDLPATIATLSQIVHDVDPESPVEYNFLDQRMQEFYTQDEHVGRIFNSAAGLAILVACLGLFGLAAFTAERRTKEIGVRKVMGASVGGIITLLSKEFLKLVAVSFVLATPLAYFAMQRWLNDFAYRTDLHLSTFLLAGLLAVGIALLSVSYQSIKAALADPVKSLRYE